jgi:hypothetical protein
MRRATLHFILIFSWVLVYPTARDSWSTATPPPDEEQAVRFLYREFRQVKSFAMIAVSLVGETDKAGLKTDEVTKYARSKFEEYFSGIRLEDVSTGSKRFMALALSRERTVGNIAFRIWVLGENYPIVYHVRCDAGNFNNPSVWTDESLGHASLGNTREAILKIIDEMMKTLAVAFFKVRAQEM